MEMSQNIPIYMYAVTLGYNGISIIIPLLPAVCMNVMCFHDNCTEKNQPSGNSCALLLCIMFTYIDVYDNTAK